MTKDQLTLRYAEIATSESSKTTLTGKSISIAIQSYVPLIAMNTSLYSDARYLEKTVTGVSKDNTLVDSEYTTEHGTDRFIYITTSQSLVTFTKVRFYYDKLFQDILIIPELAYLGSNSAGDILENDNFAVSGYLIGGFSKTLNGGNSESMMSVTESNRIKLPETKSSISSKMQLYTLPGISDDKRQGQYLERMVTPEINISNSKAYGVNVVNFGKSGNLFVNNNPLPLYTIIQSKISTYAIQSAGTNRPAESADDLCVILTF